jgi:hypothetical protein
MAMESIEPLERRIAPAIFVVTSLADSGAGSLREAIGEANDHPGADLIVFKAGLTGTIGITSGQIAITDALSIKGPGATKLALGAFRLSRIFSVSDGDNSKDSPLNVSGLSFFDGVADGEAGGAIASLESLNVKGCAFMGNGSTTGAGAIDVHQVNGDVPLDVDIRGSSFLLNSSEDGAGGAISVQVTGTVALKSNLFNTNFAKLGGAAFIEGGSENTVLLQNCRFLANHAVQNGAAAVESSGGRVIVRDSLFADNIAFLADSGGLAVSEGNVLIERSAFIRNTGQGGSGALQLDGISSLIIRSSRFLDNDSRGAGTGVGGGGLKVSMAHDGPARIIASVISGNTANQGGGIFVGSGPGTLKIVDSTITNNHATGDGGGIVVQEDLVSHEGAGLKIVRSKIAGNVSESGKGGGLAIFGDGVFTMESSQVTHNSASTTGGGLFIQKTIPSVIAGSIIAQNTAIDGGGIGAEAEVELRTCRILGNIAEGAGGGVRIRGALTIEFCTVSGNIALFVGGVLANQPVSKRDNIIINNFSPDGGQLVID